MPKFIYIVKDKEGKTFKNVTEANSRVALIDKFQKQNYFIISIKEIASPSATGGASMFKTKKKFTHKKVKLLDLLTFARQLATMLESGVALPRTLDVVQQQAKSQMMSEILFKLKKDVEQGDSLSLALSKHPKVFNQFWVSLIEVGEASGTVPKVLEKLHFYLEQQAKFQSTIISGLIYPAILFMVSMGAVGFFALFVSPRFESIYEQLGSELPAYTRAVMGVFKFVKANFLFLIGGLVGFFFLLSKYIKTYNGKLQFERFLFKLPVAGEVFRLIVVERFCSQMAILIDSGVPILYALDITERLVNNNTCALVVHSVREGVKQGTHLNEPIEKSGFFPPMATQMIMVGEETGELSKMLNHVAEFYQSEVETFMKRFSTIIEPVMLVLMGGIIGVIVIAMFLPLFNLSSAAGGGGGG